MNLYLGVFLFGGAGSIVRFLMYQGLRFTSAPFWLPTLLVNLIGSTLFFLIDRELKHLSPEWHVILKAGLLAAFTTFSTFAYEVVSLYLSGLKWEALLVMLLNMVFGIVIGILILR